MLVCVDGWMDGWVKEDWKSVGTGTNEWQQYAHKAAWTNMKWSEIKRTDMNVCTSERRNAWTNERMKQQRKQWISKRMDEWTHERTNELMNSWMNEWMHACMHQLRMTGWINESMNQWTTEESQNRGARRSDIHTYIHAYIHTHIHTYTYIYRYKCSEHIHLCLLSLGPPHTYIYIHTYVHTYIRTYIYIHMYLIFTFTYISWTFVFRCRMIPQTLNPKPKAPEALPSSSLFPLSHHTLNPKALNRYLEYHGTL